MKTVLYGLLLLLTGGVLGFFAARRSTGQAPSSVEYIREPAITGVIEPPAPVRVEVPALPTLPIRTDTVYIDKVLYIVDKVDTAAIIADYELKRSYAFQLFDNEAGKLSLSLSTQYNRLDTLSYEFLPVYKTVYMEKTWQPFAIFHYSAIGGTGVGGGLFCRRAGYYIMYSSDFRHRRGLGAGVIVRFRITKQLK